jgi:hypothetical protein
MKPGLPQKKKNAGLPSARVTGTDVMILKIFLPKNLAKILAFLTQNKASFCKNCDHKIGF